ncbi:putative oxidoreductase CipA [Lophiostoma macrostomum CBS 122681]|uniref:Putative oxidoreductase CipA n=1 Tax=Lophiostoma macrostomum CBS 122681 TaxID=1314788 RepID=A0A6A6T0D3_9PLEO|nr:putative oxidoreductase CipA [Lophiostoma macrostomum CBS 122681]
MAKKYASQLPSGSMNRIQKVAIVGAGGQVGKFIVEALLAKGTFSITAISREGSSNTPPAGVNVASIEYEDHKTIVAALRGHDALIITMSVSAPAGQQEKLIRAAAEAEVPFIVPDHYGSDLTNQQAGDDILIAAPKKKDLALVESLGVSSWVAITCSFWYEYSLGAPGFYGIDIKSRRVTWFDDGQQRLHTTTWPQVGRTVAETLSLPVYPKDSADSSATLSNYANSSVYVSSFTANQREMFDSVKRVTKTSDSDWKFNSEPAKKRFVEAKKELFSTGNRSAFPRMLYTRFFTDDGAGLYEDKHGLDNEKLGLPKEDIDEYTKKAVELAESDYYAKMFPPG